MSSASDANNVNLAGIKQELHLINDWYEMTITNAALSLLFIVYHLVLPDQACRMIV